MEQLAVPNSRVFPAELRDRSRTNSAQSSDEIPDLPGVTTSHIRQAFDEFDIDQSGWIGVSELRYVLTICGESPSEEELDEMLRMVCSDGGGQVSFDDYCKLFVDGSPMLAEMAAIREQTLAAAAPPPVVEEGTLDEGEFETLVKGAVSFMAAFGNAKAKRERDTRLPKAKARPAPGRGQQGRPRYSQESGEEIPQRGPSKQAAMRAITEESPSKGLPISQAQRKHERAVLRRGHAASVLDAHMLPPKESRASIESVALR